MLHFHNGDSVANTARLVGVPGRHLAYRETLISGKAPGYARNHLGWLGRVNGPVDNPASSCLSCHGTAQTVPQAMEVFERGSRA